MFEAEKILNKILAQANVINEKWQEFGVEQMVTTQTNIDSYLSLPGKENFTFCSARPQLKLS